MHNKAVVILCLILISAFDGLAAPAPNSAICVDVVTVSVEQQYDMVQPGSESALAVHFELGKDWHFYASAQTAPGRMNLKIKPSADGNSIKFSEPIFPQPHPYFDKFTGSKLEVFSDKFTVFLPFSIRQVPDTKVAVKIGIEGAVCSELQCRMPDFGGLTAEIAVAADAAMDKPAFVLPAVTEATPAGEPQGGYTIWFALGLAFLAGLSLNIMPCVWPVLPLIIMRLIGQAGQGRPLGGRGKSTASGLAFCMGILLFFAALAAANIILQVFYGTVLQWGDQFRSPAFVAGMALLLVALALFMFDVFTITVPSSIASKSGGSSGYSGAVGMGFLAAILSTPCSFAILAAAFAWAQTQPILSATLAIMVIGVGMAVPYAVLTSMPALLKRIPKPGQWMELFKQGIGFALLLIAVKLISALPSQRRTGVLYFAVVLAFSVWMWGGWVRFDTAAMRKWAIRAIAVILAVAAGLAFLPEPPAELIAWQKYDADSIKAARAQGRPVLIKFTADWCLSCQVVEKVVYSRQDIAKLIEEKNIFAVKADTTTKDMPATFALKDVYNEPGVPVTMLFIPGHDEPVKWRGISFADELKTLLEEIPSK